MRWSPSRSSSLREVGKDPERLADVLVGVRVRTVW